MAPGSSFATTAPDCLNFTILNTRHMRSRSLFFATMILVAGFLYSCKSKHGFTCPPFNDTAFAAWFPYEVDQKLIYKTAGSFPDTITINSLLGSGPYTLDGSAAVIDSCYSTGVISSLQTINGGARYKYIVYDYVNGDGTAPISDSVQYQFNQLSFVTGKVTDTGLNVSNLYPMVRSRFHAGYTLGSVTYGKVQELSFMDTTVTNTAFPWIYKVYIAYGKGMVGYETYPQHVTWLLQ